MAATKKPRRVKETAPEVERRADDRREVPVDRRAFWRPTPDRRREATEQGRRESDPRHKTA